MTWALLTVMAAAVIFGLLTKRSPGNDQRPGQPTGRRPGPLATRPAAPRGYPGRRVGTRPSRDGLRPDQQSGFSSPVGMGFSGPAAGGPGAPLTGGRPLGAPVGDDPSAVGVLGAPGTAWGGGSSPAQQRPVRQQPHPSRRGQQPGQAQQPDQVQQPGQAQSGRQDDPRRGGNERPDPTPPHPAAAEPSPAGRGHMLPGRAVTGSLFTGTTVADSLFTHGSVLSARSEPAPPRTTDPKAPAVR